MACQCGSATTAPRVEAQASTGCDCGCTPSPQQEETRSELARFVEELDRRLKKLESAA